MIKMKKLGTIVLAAALMAGGVLPAYASTQDDIESAEKEKEATESQLEDTESRIAALEAKKGESEAYLTELNNQLTELTGQLTDLQNQYAEKQQELDTSSQELANAQAEELRQRQDMAVRIQYMYENSTVDSGLTAVLNAGDFTEMLNAASNMNELEAYDRQALEAYAAVCDDIEVKQDKLYEDQAAIADLTEQSEAKKTELTTLYDETRQDVEEIRNNLEGAESAQAELLASIESQEAAINALNDKAAAEVAAAEAAAAEAAAQQAAAQQAAEAAAQQAAAEQSAAAEAETEAPAAETSSAPVQDTSDRSVTEVTNSAYQGAVLTRSAGRIVGPSGGETYYNLDMSGVVAIMRRCGFSEAEYPYWVRDDGVKMLGSYVMVAANLEVRPRGSLVQSSLGMALVCDTGGFAVGLPYNLDIATNW